MPVRIYVVCLSIYNVSIIAAAESKVLLFECSVSQGVYLVMITVCEYKQNHNT